MIETPQKTEQICNYRVFGVVSFNPWNILGKK